MKPIYLDYNATTPIDPAVAEAMTSVMKDTFGNPSSSHYFGLQAKTSILEARHHVSGLLGCSPAEIVFTSGGSESNNYAISGVARNSRHKGNHIITCQIEHPAVLEVCNFLENDGFKITMLKVNNKGRVDPADVEKAVTPETILITIMHANNEVGTVQELSRISEIARAHGILLHTDAAQSIGKIPVKVNDLGVDLLSVAGHKFYGPKGVGALYIRSGVEIGKLIHGADHEMNRRAGTENIIGIAGLGAACSLISGEGKSGFVHLKTMRDKLENEILRTIPDAIINGDPLNRLPNTCSISFKNIEADKILSNLSTVAASAGAACHSDGISISHVLKAMSVPTEYAMGTLRLSVGRFTTSEEIDIASGEIKRVVTDLR